MGYQKIWAMNKLASMGVPKGTRSPFQVWKRDNPIFSMRSVRSGLDVPTNAGVCKYPFLLPRPFAKAVFLPIISLTFFYSLF